MPKIIHMYLIKEIFKTFLVVVMVIGVLAGFLEFIGQIGSKDDAYNITKIIKYSLLKVPSYLYDVFSIIYLLVILTTLLRLSSSNEIIILRSSGWSIIKLFLIVFNISLLIWVAVFFIGNFMAPDFIKTANRIKLESKNTNLNLSDSNNFWIKSKTEYFNARTVLNAENLQNIQVYSMADNKINQIINAEKASLIDDAQNIWRLDNLLITSIKYIKDLSSFPKSNLDFLPDFIKLNARAYNVDVSQKIRKTIKIQLPINSSLLENLSLEPRFLGVLEIWQQMQTMKSNGLEYITLESEFYKRIFSPLVLLAMLAISFPLVFASQRSAKVGVSFLLGFMLGFVIYFANLLFINLFVYYEIPSYIGNAIFPLLLLLLAFYRIKKSVFV